MQRLVAAELSQPSRLGHVLLLVVSLIVATAIGWILGRRTVATAPNAGRVRGHRSIAVAWAVFSGWVLARRRVLFGADRVLAAKMGLAFSMLGAVGMGALGYRGGLGRGAYLGALGQALLCCLAAVLLMESPARRGAVAAPAGARGTNQQLSSRGD